MSSPRPRLPVANSGVLGEPRRPPAKADGGDGELPYDFALGQLPPAPPLLPWPPRDSSPVPSLIAMPAMGSVMDMPAGALSLPTSSVTGDRLGQVAGVSGGSEGEAAPESSSDELQSRPRPHTCSSPPLLLLSPRPHSDEEDNVVLLRSPERLTSAAPPVARDIRRRRRVVPASPHHHRSPVHPSHPIRSPSSLATTCSPRAHTCQPNQIRTRPGQVWLEHRVSACPP